MGRSHGLPRELAAAVGGPRCGQGAYTGGGDQPAGEGRVEVNGSVGEGGHVDLKSLDLKLEELKLVKPVLRDKERRRKRWTLTDSIGEWGPSL